MPAVSENYDLYFNNTKYSINFLIKNDIFYLPLKSLEKIKELNFTYNSKFNLIKIKNKKLIISPILFFGEKYLPLELIIETIKGTIEWDGKKRNIYIKEQNLNQEKNEENNQNNESNEILEKTPEKNPYAEIKDLKVLQDELFKIFKINVQMGKEINRLGKIIAILENKLEEQEFGLKKNSLNKNYQIKDLESNLKDKEYSIKSLENKIKDLNYQIKDLEYKLKEKDYLIRDLEYKLKYK